MEGLPSSKEPPTHCAQYQNIEGVSYMNELESLKSSQSLMLELSRVSKSNSQTRTPLNSQELALDLIELSRGQGDLSGQEAAHFRVLLLGINEKLKVLDLFQHQIAQLRGKLRKSLQSREKLQFSLMEASDNLKQEKENSARILLQITSERDQAKKQAQDHLEGLRNKCQDEELLNAKYQGLRADYGKLSAEHRNFDKIQILIQGLQEQVKDSEEARNSLQQKYANSLQEFQKERENTDKELGEVLKANEELADSLKCAEETVRELEHSGNRQATLLGKTQSGMSSMKTQLTAAADQAEKARNMEKLAASHQQTSSQLNEKLQEQALQHLSQIEKLSKEREEFIQKLESAATHITGLEQDIGAFDWVISSLKQEKMKLTGKLTAAEERLCVQVDSQNLLGSLSSLKESKEKFLQFYYDEMGRTTDFLVAQSEQNLSSQRLSNALSQTVKEKSNEISKLKEMFAAVKKAKSYAPVKGDSVDEALADYLNSRVSELYLPFVREDQGVYLFGTRRVFMKIENGLLIIRVGGGYMLLDEFIMLYCPVEFEKMDYKRDQSEKGRLWTDSMSTRGKGKFDFSPKKIAEIVKRELGCAATNFKTLLAVPRKGSGTKKAISNRRAGRPVTINLNTWRNFKGC